MMSIASSTPFKPFSAAPSDLKPCDAVAVTCWGWVGVTRASHEDTTRGLRTEADCAAFLFAGCHFNLHIGETRSAFIRMLPSGYPCFVFDAAGEFSLALSSWSTDSATRDEGGRRSETSRLVPRDDQMEDKMVVFSQFQLGLLLPVETRCLRAHSRRCL